MCVCMWTQERSLTVPWTHIFQSYRDIASFSFTFNAANKKKKKNYIFFKKKATFFYLNLRILFVLLILFKFFFFLVPSLFRLPVY
jgi:hypothetical protein